MYNPVIEIDEEVDRLLEEAEREKVVNASPKCVFAIEQDRIVVAQTEYCASRRVSIWSPDCPSSDWRGICTCESVTSL